MGAGGTDRPRRQLRGNESKHKLVNPNPHSLKRVLALSEISKEKVCDFFNKESSLSGCVFSQGNLLKCSPNSLLNFYTNVDTLSPSSFLKNVIEIF